MTIAALITLRMARLADLILAAPSASPVMGPNAGSS